MADTVTSSQLIAEVWFEIVSPVIISSQQLDEVWSDAEIVTETIPHALSEVWSDFEDITETITHLIAEVWWEEPVDLVIPCLWAEISPSAGQYGAIYAQYYVALRNQSGVVVAIFDTWLELSVRKILNGVGEYSISFVDDGNPKLDLFELDGKIELWRKIPGHSAWYIEFRGLHRSEFSELTQDGTRIYRSSGLTFEDLLGRTAIMYKAGFVQADKNAPAETAMKEYVLENCGHQATIANYRLTDGVLPNFSVDSDTGSGAVWAGSRAYENLLDVIKEISDLSAIDFSVEDNGGNSFIFKTYPNGIGSDRSRDGLDPVTGMNSSGNSPVAFAVEYGNVQEASYEFDRSSENNVIAVLGKGDGSTRDAIIRSKSTKLDSPWNRREITRSGGSQDFDYQLEDMGDSELEDQKAKEIFTFSPLQQSNAIYGIHYSLGDRVTAIYKTRVRTKRISEVVIDIVNGEERVSLEFSDVP